MGLPRGGWRDAESTAGGCGCRFPRTRAAGAAARLEPLLGACKYATYRSGHASSEWQNPSLDFGSQLKTSVKSLRRNLRWFRATVLVSGSIRLGRCRFFWRERRSCGPKRAGSGRRDFRSPLRPQPWDAACGAHRQRRGWSRRAAGFGRCVRRSSEPRLLPTSEKPLGYTRQTRDASRHRAAGATASPRR